MLRPKKPTHLPLPCEFLFRRPKTCPRATSNRLCLSVPFRTLINTSSRDLPSFSLSRKVVGGALLLLAGILLFAIFISIHTRRLIQTEDKITYTLQVLEKDQELLRSLLETEAAAQVYLLTPSEEQYAVYQEARKETLNVLENFRSLLEHQPKNLASIEALLAQHLSSLAEIVELRRTSTLEDAVRLFQERKVTLNSIRVILRRITEEQREALANRQAVSARLRRSTFFVISTGLLIAVLGLSAAAMLRHIAVATRADRQLAQERDLLRRIIDAIPLQIFVKDKLGRYMIDNLAHRDFIGASRKEDIFGKTAADYLPGPTAQAFAQSDTQIFATGEPMIEREEIVASTTGHMAWLSTTKIPLKTHEGEVVGLVGTSMNISERKKAEEKLRLFASKLEASNEELREFASVASHDLQEPLRKIRAFADRLRAKYGDALGEQGRDYLSRMQSAGLRMQALIEDILILSRLSSNARLFEQVDLSKVMENVLADLELRIEQTKAHIEVGFLPVIEADPVQMHQLFQNLISNALKFHKPNIPPEITVSAKILQMHDKLISGAAPGDEVCQIMVTDNGIGIEEKYAEQIFVLFQRLHDLNFYQGTGIGLSVCRKITQRHGGSITVKSAKNEGATFIVMLPLKQMSQPL